VANEPLSAHLCETDGDWLKDITDDEVAMCEHDVLDEHNDGGVRGVAGDMESTSSAAREDSISLEERGGDNVC